MPPKRTRRTSTFDAETLQPLPRRTRITTALLQKQIERLQAIIDERNTVPNKWTTANTTKKTRFENFKSSGLDDPVAWYDDFRGTVEVYKMEPRHQLIFMKRHIIGEVRKHLDYLPLHRTDTVEKISNELKDRYYEDLTESDRRVRLNWI